MQDVPVISFCFASQGEGGSLPSEARQGYSRKDWQERHRGRLQASIYNLKGVVESHVDLACMWGSAPDWGAVFRCTVDKSIFATS